MFHRVPFWGRSCLIYINDLFYFVREDRITNYADDTTPYTINNSYAELVDALQLDSCILLEWVNNNFFTLNPGKCKLLISGKQDDLSIDIEGKSIICEKTVKLLAIKIDNLLNFCDHISSICKNS